MMRECSNYLVYAVAAFVSLFISYWIAAHQLWINPDAICYLQSARLLSRAPLASVMHYCGQAIWPFYSLLIEQVARLFHFSYQTTAYGLDGLFSLISVLTFILIVKQLGGKGQVLLLAALTILFAHEFNSTRDYIIRDHGFWAFYLLSVLFLLQYVNQGKVWQALAVNLSLIIASLFRIEGVIFLILLPQVSWFVTSVTFKKRLQFFLFLNASLLAGVLFFLPWIAWHHAALLNFGRVPEMLNQAQHAFAIIHERYHNTAAMLRDQVLSEDGKGQASEVVLMMMLAWYLLTLINNFSVLYVILLFSIFGYTVRTWSKNHLVVLSAYILINLVITLVFLNERFFLSKRYLIAFSLVLMLWVPFALASLIKRQRLIFYGVGLWLLLSTVWHLSAIDHSKRYLVESADWLATHVPVKADLYSNDLQIMYYSHHFNENIFQKYAQPLNGNYDYMAIRLRARDPDPNLKTMTLVQTFKNKHDDRVMIYQSKQSNQLMAEKN